MSNNHIPDVTKKEADRLARLRAKVEGMGAKLHTCSINHTEGIEPGATRFQISHIDFGLGESLASYPTLFFHTEIEPEHQLRIAERLLAKMEPGPVVNVDSWTSDNRTLLSARERVEVPSPGKVWRLCLFEEEK